MVIAPRLLLGAKDIVFHAIRGKIVNELPQVLLHY